MLKEKAVAGRTTFLIGTTATLDRVPLENSRSAYDFGPAIVLLNVVGPFFLGSLGVVPTVAR